MLSITVILILRTLCVPTYFQAFAQEKANLAK